MELKEQRKKSRAILEALARGHSVQQVLAADCTLTCHDVFHAVTEVPTRYWRKKPAASSANGCPRPAQTIRTSTKHWID